MKKLLFAFILLFCALAAKPTQAQTTFVVFTNLLYQEVQPLLTDSLVVENTNNIRHIGQAFDGKGRMTGFRDSTFDLNKSLLAVSTGSITHMPLKLVQITRDERFAPFAYTSMERLTIDSLDSKKMSKILYESWDGSKWVENQRTYFTYDAAGRQTEMWSENWDFLSMSWKNSFSNFYVFDANGNQVKYQTRNWDAPSNSWLVNNEYQYTYNAAGKRLSETWYNFQNNTLTPLQRSTYAYDAAGNLDSIKYYDAFVTGPWRYYSYILLDDSAEQQITRKGKQFDVDAQGNFLPASETSFIPGPKVYTTQPTQELTQKFDPATQSFKNSERYLTDFALLPDGRVKGNFTRATYENNNWKTIYKVEGWLRKPGSVATHSPQPATVLSCGFPNPLSMEQIDGLVRSLPDQQASSATFWGMDGRTSAQQVELPGVYWLRVMDKGRLTCAQKVVVR